ncbi:porin family protein [Vibrio sp. SM6]|uniref:Porin family protein n=1 Tax=Vibrio agarilyticus TaxID=2726741 RepID=A0A7X8TT89_9VIBR|nr:outer membrane beta-barrel protein [Vibrio agarilyticus]NLS14389.1 porin family protein [Vibrio agarilyticus]
MKKSLLALALFGASTSVFADSWIYGGASVGASDFDGKSDTAYNLHVGTGILPIIGIEAGLTNLGTFDIKGKDNKITTYYAALKPSIDLGPLHVWAKGGFHAWDNEISGAANKDGTDLMFGVGAEYFVFGPISVGASYMNYTIDNKEAETFSLNASFHFL